MARPTKQGLDYFPMDVGFFEDVKVRRLQKDCGNQAISILIAIFCIAYRDEGYYVEINSDLTFLIADRFGVSEDAVLKIVEKAIQVGIFDSDQFHNHKILTSRGIQKRYFQAASRKTEVLVHRDFLLSGVNVCKNSVYVDNNGVSVCNNPQSKVKESKVKKNKENGAAPPCVSKKDQKHQYGECRNVLLTDEELGKLKEKYPGDFEKRIDDLGYYIASTGKSYKSHYMTILSWARKEKKKAKSGRMISRKGSEDTDDWMQKQKERSRRQSLRGDET